MCLIRLAFDVRFADLPNNCQCDAGVYIPANITCSQVTLSSIRRRFSLTLAIATGAARADANARAAVWPGNE